MTLFRVVNLSFLGKEFGRIWAEIDAESKLKEKWVESTPWVLVRYPRWDREKRISLSRLGRIHAWELSIPGPRGGKGKAHKTLDVFGTGYSWSKCDVRLVTPEVLREIEAIEAQIKEFQQREKNLLHERFFDLDPLTFEQIQEAGRPWRRVMDALSAYRKGEATRQYLEDTIKDVLG